MIVKPVVVTTKILYSFYKKNDARWGQDYYMLPIYKCMVTILKTHVGVGFGSGIESI